MSLSKPSRAERARSHREWLSAIFFSRNINDAGLNSSTTEWEEIDDLKGQGKANQMVKHLGRPKWMQTSIEVAALKYYYGRMDPEVAFCIMQDYENEYEEPSNMKKNK